MVLNLVNIQVSTYSKYVCLVDYLLQPLNVGEGHVGHKLNPTAK